MRTLGGTCSWTSRWRHRRQRWTDVEIMWPSLVARAESVAEARVAWEVFLAQPGQAHWHCACGAPLAELFRCVTITVE
jgi:hypothetical protein